MSHFRMSDSNLDDDNLKTEKYRLAGRVQLKQYGTFLDKYGNALGALEKSFSIKDYLSVDVMSNIIEYQFDAWEDINILQLVQSDNRVFSKVIASLVSVCNDASTTVEHGESHFYHKLLYYGKDDNENRNSNKFSSLFSTLHEICVALKKARSQLELILLQLGAVSRKHSKVSLNISTIYFVDPIIALADLLVYNLVLECLLNNETIKNDWNIYKKMSRKVQHSDKTFHFPKDELKAFDKMLHQIENELLSENLFRTTIELCLEKRNLLFGKSGCSDELGTYLTNVLNNLEKNEQNLMRKQNWLRVNVLTVFYYNIFGNLDKKILRRLLEYNKKVAACTLIGNLPWYPEQFLLHQIPSLIQMFDDRYLQSSIMQRQSLLGQRAQNILRDTTGLAHKTSLWGVQIYEAMQQGTSQLQLNDLQRLAQLFLLGMILGDEIANAIKWITNIHASEATPINRTVLICIFRLNSLLKGIVYTYKVYLSKINFCITLIIQYYSYQVLLIIKNIRRSMTQDKSYKDQNLDILAALKIAEQALNGPPTQIRLLVARVALSTTFSLPGNIYDHIRGKLNEIEILTNMSGRLNQICDVSFFYWHQTLLQVYFKSIFDGKVDLRKLTYTFYGVNDCFNDCLSKEESVEFSSSIKGQVDRNLLQPFFQAIEISLRLQTHSHLNVHSANVFETLALNCNELLETKPIRIDNYFVSIKADIEHYLSTTFYNLATVVLHDWRTYGEMRRLAYFKHAIETVQDYLPNQTLEQGLDVLEIMRNINIFVSKYLYNLNNQIFIEQASKSKHLNTINIRHIANSIRMHGLGIMNTTVNFTYQFLQKKFYVFSQFMFDEQIKSRLIKDIRFFRENKEQLEQMFPFDRAEKFNRSIRKLGLTPNGDSYLDLFRVLISHIGNAMGYIRMIRSGGRHFCANAVSYLADADNRSSDSKVTGFSDSSQICLEQLNHQIQTLSDHFDEKTEYFKLLVEVFAPVFRTISNKHLRNFYVIIPPLTLNFVEYSLKCREKLNKKNKSDASFTDDGFAMGVAYILELLEQGSEWSSLHWFQSVRVKYKNDRINVNKQKNQVQQNDKKLLQTLTLTEQRILSYEQEFELLYFNLNSARILFR